MPPGYGSRLPHRRSSRPVHLFVDLGHLSGVSIVMEDYDMHFRGDTVREPLDICSLLSIGPGSTVCGAILKDPTEMMCNSSPSCAPHNTSN